MKILKNLLFILTIIIGASAATFAQDEKKVPKKDPPPVVRPAEKEKPKEKPREDNKSNRPKKPEYEASVSSGIIRIILG